jgi:hypothetical protein
MNDNEKVAQALHAKSQAFVTGIKQRTNIDLDYSLASLLPLGLAMRWGHSVYKAGLAKDVPRFDESTQSIAQGAACYVSEMLMKHRNATIAVKDALLVAVVQGVEIPVGAMMLEELKTGKAHSIGLFKLLDTIHARNTRSEILDPGNVEAESRQAAAVAIQDVRTMIKEELDYSLASLGIVDRALQRLKTVAEFSPDHKSNLVRASCDKYGSYIGEVIVKQIGGKWIRLKNSDATVNAVDLGGIVTVPSRIVHAVLEGKTLDMGEKAAANVIEFAAIVEERKKAAPADGLFANLDAPGEAFKRIKLFAEEGVRMARADYAIELDYSLFSLDALDQAIAQRRKKLEADKSSLTEENLRFERATSALALGSYLGEVIVRAHGGSWEDMQPWAKLRAHMMKFDPITVVGALLRGEAANANRFTRVALTKEYYQAIRPVLYDVLTAKLYGAAGNEETLLAQMGPDLNINKSVLHFAEACLALAYDQFNIELDFSEDSLNAVDRMLDDFHKRKEEEVKATLGLTREDLIRWYAAYSGEVFRRVLGGVWENDGGAHILWEGNRIFVGNKVGKFLKNGMEDSVAFLLRGVRGLKDQGRLSASTGAPTPPKPGP